MKAPPAPVAQQEIPRPDIMVGDSVYFEHPKRGHMSARVIARGKHGCTAACHLGDLYRIHWEKIIGIKEQTKQKFTMIEKGATGCIVEDDCGRRHFIETATADYQEFEKEAKEKEKTAKKPIKKALPTGMMLLKGRVKGHVRHTETGKVIAVNPYDTRRTKKDEKTGDLFDLDPEPASAPAPAPENPFKKIINKFAYEHKLQEDEKTRNAFSKYQGNFGYEINSILRGTDFTGSHIPERVERIKGWAKTMQDAFNDASQRDLSDLWRGEKGKFFDDLIREIGILPKKFKPTDFPKMIGLRFTDKGFVSTSTDRAQAEKFRRSMDLLARSYYNPVLFKFQGSAKTITPEEVANINNEENEVLIQDGTSFEIADMRADPDDSAIWIVTLKVVGNEATPAKRPPPPTISEDLRKAVEDGDPTRSYSQNHEDQVQVTAKALKISADAYREKLQNHVERVVASSSIWIRTPMYAINAILRDGRFKNQYETGRSSGVFKPQKRQRFEEFFFGYPERDQDKGDAVGLGRDSHLTPEQEAQRPIYGYLSDHPDGIAAMVSGKDTMAHYGGVFIKMKDDVRPYTTFCHGDSLTYMSGVESGPSPGKVGIAYPPEAQFLPSPVTQPSYRSLNFRDVVYPNQSEGKRKASLTYDPQNIGPQGTIYFEAQLHGGNYGPDDIAEVVFSKLPPEGTIDAEHVMEALDKAGIPWRTLKK